MDLAQRLIAEEEGCTAFVVKDTLGYDTIAIGCCVDKHVRGAGLCQGAIDVQFAHDCAQAKINAARIPRYFQCNDVQKAVLTSLCFQLGAQPLEWPVFNSAMARGDFTAAAAAGRDSDWARTETPERAAREMEMLETGVWVPHE